MDKNEKKFRQSPIAIICYLIAVVMLGYACYQGGSTVKQINEYYASYGMSASAAEYATYVLQAVMEPLFQAFVIFMAGYILNAVRKLDPKNYKSVSDILEMEEAKKEARDMKQAAKGEARAAKSGKASRADSGDSVRADFTESFEAEMKKGEGKSENKSGSGRSTGSRTKSQSGAKSGSKSRSQGSSKSGNSRSKSQSASKSTGRSNTRKSSEAKSKESSNASEDANKAFSSAVDKAMAALDEAISGGGEN